MPNNPGEESKTRYSSNHTVSNLSSRWSGDVGETKPQPAIDNPKDYQCPSVPHVDPSPYGTLLHLAEAQVVNEAKEWLKGHEHYHYCTQNGMNIIVELVKVSTENAPI